MLKLIICGINGAMGTQIYHSAISKNHEVVCGIDKTTLSNIECPIYNDFDQINHHANVIVDFSSPTITERLLDFAIDNCLPLVIGTTGHTKRQEKDILDASTRIPIFKSANTSLGVNLFIKLCKIAASYLNNFDVSIIEKHHINKKDSPSGTANLIYDEISKANHNLSKSNIHSLRGGTIVGEHSVIYLGRNESITLTHSAQSKQLFASGAIDACEFIVKQQSGLYTMEDLIDSSF